MRCFYMFGMMIFSACASLAQNDLFVATNGVDSGNCQNAGAPCATLKYAWAQASTVNDVIHLAPGVYTENNITTMFVNSRNPFRGESPSNTILQAHPLPGMATSRIFEVTFDGSGFKLQNLTLRHGVAPEDPLSTAGGDGGAIKSRGIVEISNCVFVVNQSGNGDDVVNGFAGSAGRGGAVFNSGTMMVFDSLFVSNFTGNGGSSTNHTTARSGGNGAGLYNTSTLGVYRTTFRQNQGGIGGTIQSGNILGVGGSGAAIYSTWMMDMDQCTVQENESGPGGHGGGIQISLPITGDQIISTITRSLICDNATGKGEDEYNGVDGRDGGSGGGMYISAFGSSNSSSVIIQNTTITGNRASDGGDGNAGLFGGGGAGGNGGGLAFRPASYAQVHLDHGTIVSNQSGAGGTGDFGGVRGQGAGIYIEQFASFTNEGVFIANTILSQNSIDGGLFIECERAATEGVLHSKGYNIFTGLNFCTLDGVTNGNLVATDPFILARQDEGGPTLMHPVLGVSPAIDAGDPAFSSPPVTDQRGVLRELNGRIDIGAYESLPVGDDSDGDGIPSQYELDNDLDPASDDRNEDNDGDGSNNFAEYSADSDPDDAANVWPGIIDITINSPPDITTPSTNSRVYTLQYTTELNDTSHWVSVEGKIKIPGTGSPLDLTDDTPTQNDNDHRAYRVIVGPPDHANTDALLSALNISVGSIVQTFDPNLFNYTATGSYGGVTSVTISGTKHDAAASVSGFGPRPLSPGGNLLDVTVTAEDPAFTATYTVFIFRPL